MKINEFALLHFKANFGTDSELISIMQDGVKLFTTACLSGWGGFGNCKASLEGITINGKDIKILSPLSGMPIGHYEFEFVEPLDMEDLERRSAITSSRFGW